MTYDDAVRFLMEFGMFGARFGLETTRHLADQAGNPQDSLRFIHVAGTNGKGSVCAMVESMCRAAGYRTGLYTSPHLVSFNERIQIDGRPIGDDDLVRGVERLREWVAALPAGVQPTFFEASTVLAFDVFSKARCEVVVLETGLGGRLDSTNVVRPLACAITNVERDHEQWLGRTPAAIATEKAGILKSGVPAVTGAESPEALASIQAVARAVGAPLRALTARESQTELESLEAQTGGPIRLGLAGPHQRQNAGLALALIDCVAASFPVAPAKRRAGLESVGWPGRFEIVTGAFGVRTVLDGAHNPAAAAVLQAAMAQSFPGERYGLILGCMADKAVAEIAHALVPGSNQVWVVPVQSPRSADPARVAEACRQSAPAAAVEVCGSLDAALEMSSQMPLRLVAGSLYLVGQARECLGLSRRRTVDEKPLNTWVQPATPESPLRADGAGRMLGA